MKKIKSYVIARSSFGYPIEINIALPLDSQILSVELLGSEILVHAAVDLSVSLHNVKFFIVNGSMDLWFDNFDVKFLGIVRVDPSLVFHVFYSWWDR